MPVRGRRRGRRRAVLVASLVVGFLVAVAALLGYRGVRAAHAASEGKDALLAAERLLRAGDPDAARLQLMAANAAFDRVGAQVDALGPLGAVGRQVPFVRVQLRGVEAFAGAGKTLASAGLELSDAAAQITDPPDDRVPVARAIDSLRGVHAALVAAEASVIDAAEQISALNGYRLIGPLDHARRQIIDRLPDALRRTRSAAEGLGAFLVFAGDEGPRRYLLLSQNPDEARPTGGFIGTYGVLTTTGGELELERYDSIESWYLARPDAVIPPDQAPSPFRFPDIPIAQTIANANAIADWPSAASVASDLWEKGGEQPVDGVIGFTPELLARLIRVLGPIEVPDFDENVTADNVIERIDFYTHGEAAEQVRDADRKVFLSTVARVVLDRLLAAPASSWKELSEAVALSFDRRELMASSEDDSVEGALGIRMWNGRLPNVPGDFFFNGEFAYAAKNSRGVRRTFDHHVELRPDGSGVVTTTMTIANTLPYDPIGSVNVDSLSYIVLYGPEGATLAPSSDRPTAIEPTVHGHPAAGWSRSARPLGTTTLTVSWDVPKLAVQRDDGTWDYRLTWLPVSPFSRGRPDELRLKISLPAGWRWTGGSPPPTVRLDRMFRGSWTVKPG